MKTLLRLSILSAFILGSAVAEEFDLDAAHTNVGFSVKHLVLSNTKGNFKEFSGTLTYDANDLASAKFTAKMQVKSINTENEKRDEHLKGADFFDATHFPEISFESSKFEKSDKGVNVSGKLTLHGVTKDVTLPVEFTDKINDGWGNMRMGMHSEFVVNRQDYGVSYGKVLDNGGLAVGNDVKVEVDAEWTVKKAAA